MNITKYPLTIAQERTDHRAFWTATSAVLHGCVGQGDTAEKAIQKLATNENEWIDAAKKHGIPIPEKKQDIAEDHSPQAQQAHNEHSSSALSQGGIKMTTFEDFLKAQMQDPEFRREFETRKPEFAPSPDSVYVFHRAVSIETLPDCRMRLVFRDGAIRVYDVKTLFDDLPQLRTLERDPALFHSARLDPGGYGIFWNDELDLSCDEVYEYGEPE